MIGVQPQLRNQPDPERDDAHALMPAWLAEQIPPLYGQEDTDDPMVYVRWFTPDGSWTWYVTEYSAVAPDGMPRLAFGLVDGLDGELGYISLEHVERVRGGLGLRVERDLWWTPRLLSEVRAELGR